MNHYMLVRTGLVTETVTQWRSKDNRNARVRAKTIVNQLKSSAEQRARLELRRLVGPATWKVVPMSFAEVA